jgi:hypothetical protein
MNIKVFKKIGHDLCIFDKEKRLKKKKKTCPHIFLECIKHVKGLLKDNDFV